MVNGVGLADTQLSAGYGLAGQCVTSRRRTQPGMTPRTDTRLATGGLPAIDQRDRQNRQSARLRTRGRHHRHEYRVGNLR